MYACDVTTNQNQRMAILQSYNSANHALFANGGPPEGLGSHLARLYLSMFELRLSTCVLDIVLWCNGEASIVRLMAEVLSSRCFAAGDKNPSLGVVLPSSIASLEPGTAACFTSFGELSQPPGIFDLTLLEFVRKLRPVLPKLTPCRFCRLFVALLAILWANISRRGVAGIRKGPSRNGSESEPLAVAAERDSAGSSAFGSRRAIGVEASVPKVIKAASPVVPSWDGVGDGMESTKE